ncbi:MAG: succinate dehydrogenase [Peptococcaceae bacterium]|nr:succinate dehydrogenase [Peptococcaceae bacterium]
MQVQRSIARNQRMELFLDMAELVSGLLLVGFLWTHMIFVGTIIINPNLFNALAAGLDRYYLSYIGIPFIIVIFFSHLVIAGRRIPTRFQEQKIMWRHASMLGERDTWTWVFQAVTGMAILVLASIHMWVVIENWPISAVFSALRVQRYLWLYLVLLFVGEFHAGTGLYRLFVKWGWFKRQSVFHVIETITVLIVVMGLGALWVFLRLGVRVV